MGEAEVKSGEAKVKPGEAEVKLGAAEVMQLWETCKDYSTALELNREFLRGRHSCTPYHGPLDPETAELLDGLHRLHDFDFLTIRSQPSQHDGPFFVVEPTRCYSDNQALVGFTNRVTSFLDLVGHLERKLSLEPEKLEDPVNDLVSNRRLLDRIGMCITGLEGMVSKIV